MVLPIWQMVKEEGCEVGVGSEEKRREGEAAKGRWNLPQKGFHQPLAGVSEAATTTGQGQRGGLRRPPFRTLPPPASLGGLRRNVPAVCRVWGAISASNLDSTPPLHIQIQQTSETMGQNGTLGLCASSWRNWSKNGLDAARLLGTGRAHTQCCRVEIGGGRSTRGSPGRVM